MQYLLLILACLPGYDCVKMHSEVLYYTEQACLDDRKAIYYELSELVEDKKAEITLFCEASIPVSRPNFL